MKPSSAETAPSCIWPSRESVVSSQWSAIRRPVIGAVLQRAPHQPGDATGMPSSVKPAAPASASSPISVSSAPDWPFVIAARKPTGISASACALLDERAERRRRVDDRIGVRHREDRAVAAGRGGRGAGGDRLLVLASGRAQVHVRVDEGRREHEARRPRSTRCEFVSSSVPSAAITPSSTRTSSSASMPATGSRTRAPRTTMFSFGVVFGEQHHATSSTDSVLTSTGPFVSRS